MIDLSNIPNKNPGDDCFAAEFDLLLTAVREMQVVVFPAVAPTVSAGAAHNFNLPTVAGNVTGTATPGSSAIVSTLWSRVSGPTVTLATPNALSCNFSAVSGEGALVLNLRATDANGLHTDSQVTLTFVYVLPQISAQNDTIQLPTTGDTLVANTTAGSYAIAGKLWSFVSGPVNATINSATGVFAGCTAPGDYVFQVVVADVNGRYTTANAQVHVSAAAFNAVVDYVFLDHDGFTALQTADALTYSQYTILSNNADWAMPWANAPANCFPVMRVLSSANQTVKNRYTDSGNPTFGTDTFDGNSSSARHFTIRGYDYYTWYSPANFVTTSGNTVVISIN